MGAVALPAGSVFLPDTACLIYLVEQVDPYLGALRPLFEDLRSGRLTAVVSAITLTEVLTKPLREGDSALAGRFRDIVLHARNTTVVPVGVPVAEQAAGLRARYGLRTPDAVQIATALEAGCTHVIANDLSWKRVTEIPVVILDEVVAS